MQLLLVVLGVVVLGSSACAPKYRFPAAVYGRYLKQPYAIGLATGEDVPCGRGLVMAVHDRLLSCTIDRPATIELYDFPAGAELGFQYDGTLEYAEYVEREGTLVHGEDSRDVRVISFDSEGEVTRSNVERRQGTVAAFVPRDATAK